jgi:DNA recombination protein RmuC
MLFSELVFVLLLVAVLVLTAFVGFMVAGMNRRTEAQGAELARMRAQLAAGDQAQDSALLGVLDRLGHAQAQLEGLRSVVTARQEVEEDARRSLRRLEAVVAGNRARGAAGENILDDALRHLPPDMVQRNAWIKGRVVEFALRLPGGKLLPVDSKWTSGAALEEAADPELQPPRRAQLAGQIEREVERRAREVSQYIDPATTAPFALAVVPDGAYATCRGAFAEAHRRHVIIVGYSMALPYLLAVYQMHLQFARSVDMENLQACLMDVDSQLDGLDGILENKLQRALTMLGNTYQEGRQGVARIRASVQSIQAAERMEALPSLSVLEEGDRPEASPEVVEDDRLHDNGLEDRRPPLGALRRG